MTFRNKPSPGTIIVKDRKPNNKKKIGRKKSKSPKQDIPNQLCIWCGLGIENTCNVYVLLIVPMIYLKISFVVGCKGTEQSHFEKLF